MTNLDVITQDEVPMSAWFVNDFEGHDSRVRRKLPEWGNEFGPHH